MYYVLWIVLGILAILIAVFQVKTYQYNRRNRNIIIASLKKDIWPYWILWVIWFILLLFMLFYKGISVSSWRYVSDWFDGVKESIKTQDEKYDDGDNISNNIYRGIITEEQVQQIVDRNGIDIIPITDGYYEIITSDDTSLPVFIDTSRYVIPTPENVNYCSIDKKYWNLWGNGGGNLGLNYNGFVYEYINSHRQKDVLVALLDSGIDGDNAVLKGHIAINSGEVKDGKDNDNDGYIDDISGVNVVLGNGNVQDYNGHGSHVAGIILQTFPHASILPIKLVDGNSEYVDEYDIIKGLRYAIDAGVDIINMSFGGKGFNEVTEALIKEANEKGIIVIAAAGNEGDDISQYYPASYTGVINVGSLGYTGISSYSNYVADILAPGECVYSYGLSQPLEFWGGTSMSAPHIAGILGTYISLGNNLSDESSALDILNNAEKKKDNMEIIDMPKLIGIEKNNDNLYSYIGTINDTLKIIQTKLNKLQQSSFTESDLNSVASYKSTLSSKAISLGNLYSKLGMITGFGLELSRDIEEYNKLLGQLNPGGLFLEVAGGTLSGSLGVETCNPYPTNCNVFDKILYKGTTLPNSNYKGGYETTEDNQTSVRFGIYQGENDVATNNKYLGEVILSVPSKLKGDVKMTVYFNVDKNGKLSVTAEDENNPSNKVSTTVIAARNTVVVTGDNYYKVKSIIAELIPLTEKILSKIQSFYNLNPFEYIPEVSTGFYQVVNMSGNIPEYKEINTGVDAELITGVEIQFDTGINKKTGVNYSSILSKPKINENIKVDKVIDGDTIRVFINGKSVKVRLIGVDAPESNDTRYGYTECFGNASTKYLTNILSNKTIGLEYDLTQGMYDKYDRLLAYVFLNGENINKKIISNGYAWEYTYSLPYKYQSEFKAAQSEAVSLNKGLWGETTCNGERKQGY